MQERLVRWLAIGMLFAAPAAYAFPAGTGRISFSPTWRLTPNTTFERSAQLAGFALRRPSPGGPGGVVSFAYAATPEIEIELSFVAGAERLPLTGIEPLTSVTYGGLVGVRAGYAFWDDRLRPSVLIATGPLLVLVSGANVNGVQEKLTQGWVGGLGLSIQLAQNWDFNIDYRLILASRGLVDGIGSINGGGSWFSIGFSYLFAPDVSHPPQRTVPAPNI